MVSNENKEQINESIQPEAVQTSEVTEVKAIEPAKKKKRLLFAAIIIVFWIILIVAANIKSEPDKVGVTEMSEDELIAFVKESKVPINNSIYTYGEVFDYLFYSQEWSYAGSDENGYNMVLMRGYLVGAGKEEAWVFLTFYNTDTSEYNVIPCGYSREGSGGEEYIYDIDDRDSLEPILDRLSSLYNIYDMSKN
ncbi:MAG: hypothetical protein K2K44_02710 [Oscillospiraceae bacterium]|nr:hypothetical protein [Oscillospiraceae bacterium]